MPPWVWGLALIGASFLADNTWRLVYLAGGCVTETPCAEARLAYLIPWMLLGSWAVCLAHQSPPRFFASAPAIILAGYGVAMFGLYEPAPFYQLGGAMLHLGVVIAGLGMLLYCDADQVGRRLLLTFVVGHVGSLVEFVWARLTPLVHPEHAAVLAQGYGVYATLLLPGVIVAMMVWSLWPWLRPRWGKPV